MKGIIFFAPALFLAPFCLFAIVVFLKFLWFFPFKERTEKSENLNRKLARQLLTFLYIQSYILFPLTTLAIYAKIYPLFIIGAIGAAKHGHGILYCPFCIVPRLL